ncbi:MAG: glycerol-3-phosphate 1-O-acyltransferase PlsY [Pseudomonadota bacterium]|nr:glycerol-3-phosphate 1-O-acyltransferase PlsY [Pseudomonadota bacterium]
MITTLLIGAYLLGSIPFGLIITRLAGLGDVRAIGSGNIGATNVLRAGNKKLAVLTLLCDAAKGFTAVLLARSIAPDALSLAGLCAVLGHVFPIWLKWRGGKGVATAIGVLLALSLPLALIVCAVWLVIFLPFRIVSLASMAGIAGAPVAAHILGDGLALPTFILALLIVFTHRANIRRLMNGTEHRFGKTAP